MQNIKLLIADLVLDLKFDNHEWFDYCKKKFARFIIERNNKNHFEIVVKILRSKSYKDIKIRYLSATTSEIFFPDSIRHFQFLSFAIKNSLAGMLLSKNRGMIHASGVILNHKAYLFVGKSGEGKSTAAKLAGGKILADDRSIFRIIGEKVYIYGSPFPEANPFPKQNSRYELGAIFLLRKVRSIAEVICKPITKKSALFKLLPHAVIRDEAPPEEKQQQIIWTFHLCQKLVVNIPVYTLSYDAKEKEALSHWLWREFG